MITSVRLEGFKNFADATLRLGPLTVIVGANASGKSNIRDAFRFIHGVARGYTLAEIMGEKYGEGGELQWKGIRGGTREAASFGRESFLLTTTASITNDEDRNQIQSGDAWVAQHSISVAVGDSRIGPRLEAESLREDRGPIYDLQRFGPTMIHGDHLGIAPQYSIFQSILSQFAGDGQGLSLSQRAANRFVTELRSMRFLDLSPAAMRVPSIPGQLVLGDRGENLSSVLQAICTDDALRIALSEWIRELTPVDVVDFEFIPDQTGRILVSLVDSHGNRTSAYSASDGTLRFLAMIAALLGPDSAKFYFLEEFENGIHPTRLYLLLQLIEQQARAGKVQVVTTTHSPQLLGMLSEEARESASLIYRLEGQQYANIQPIMEIPSIREVLQKQNLARLHESGWLEKVMAFSQPEEIAS